MASTPPPLRAPVAFMIFNRPEFTARVFEAIARARPPKLLVVADGPRTTHPADERLCREARAVMERVDWPCEVLTCYSEVNLGCKARIASGLDWVFDQVQEAIVVEDDCLPEPSFFRFCDELLERYRHDPRVHMVSGVNVLPPSLSGEHSYYFSRCYHIWGWASWARAWRTYDLRMPRWPELRRSDWLERHVRDATAASIVRQLFDATYAGTVTTWDFQWVFAGWTHAALSVIPAVNLVTNIGYGEAATNERDENHPFANLPTWPIEFPLRHPADVGVLEPADAAEWSLMYPRRFDGAPSGRGTRLREALGSARHVWARRRAG